MFVSVSSAGDASNNGAFPIVQRISDNTIAVGNPGAVSGSLVGATYALVSGAGPTPARVDFLDDGTTQVDIALADGTGTIDGFQVNVAAAGEGYTIDDETVDNLTDMPVDGSAVDFGCTGTNGDCGAKPVGLLVTVINGRTTDGSTAGLPGFVMPAPTDSYATFRCSFTSDDVTIPADAMAAIMGTSPSRIETRIFKFNGSVGASGTLVVVGHGYVGWTTP
jgi:hypothetical protein